MNREETNIVHENTRNKLHESKGSTVTDNSDVTSNDTTSNGTTD